MGTLYGSEEICSVYRENPSKFIEDILEVHNQYRAIHGSPPLQIDKKLNERAQQLAESLSKKGREALKEAYIPYGENVYVRHPYWRMLPEEPVQYWYQENRYYNYDAPQPRNLKYVRNFTQLLWKDSKLMGMGIVTGLDGKVYLVCSYDPPANVDGEFQRNISRPKEDVPVPSLEESEIEFVKPNEELVRSMERLYAVPSEKLRVWMVWLTGVGEIADEWHKWLRAHIDLIAERLRMVANNVPRGGTKIESVTNAKFEKIPDNAMPTRGKEERDVYLNSFDEKPGIINDKVTNDPLSAKVSSNNRANVSQKKIESSANEGLRARNNPTTANIGRRIGGEEETAKTTKAKAKKTATIWQPLTRCPIEEKADQMETIRMSQDETERFEFMKNFAHQATLYGSYYKHWIETANQAVKEIAGRTVMTTAKFRGTGDSESTLDVAAPPAAQYSMKQPESAVAQPTGGTTAATTETPMSNRIDPPTTDALGRDAAEASITLSDNQSKVVEPSIKKETAGMEAESPSARLDNTAVSSSPSAKPETTPEKWTTMGPIVPIPMSLLEQEAAAKRKAAERLTRDMARAEENIPYFFYLKAEPDMDIAIRYNDEKVIPRDSDRESISANRKHLYFNLTDKPIKI